MSDQVLIRIEDVSRIFPVPGGEFAALKKINATINKGSFTILKGRSGSGKTTLMNIVGGLDAPSSGKVFIEDCEISSLSEKERENLRRKDFGFVLEESLSHIFEIIHRHHLTVSLVQSSAVTISVCVDNNRFVERAIQELQDAYLVTWNDNLRLLTIRGTTPEILKKEQENRTILLSQTTRRTARLVITH